MNTMNFHNVTKLLVESDNGATMNLYIVQEDGTKTNIILHGAHDNRPTTHECDVIGDEI